VVNDQTKEGCRSRKGLITILEAVGACDQIKAPSTGFEGRDFLHSTSTPDGCTEDDELELLQTITERPGGI